MRIDYALTPVFLDLETRSCVDLGRHGGRVYAMSPTTQVLTIAWKEAGGPVRTWSNPQAVHGSTGTDSDLSDLFRLAADPSKVFVAHNAFNFDATVWDRMFPANLPTAWADTVPVLRGAGLPAKLEDAARVLLGAGKLAMGKDLLKRYSVPDKKTGRFRPVPPGAASMLLDYNVWDVELLAGVWQRLEALGVVVEADVLQAHQDINERGIAVDVHLVAGLMQHADRQRLRAAEEVRAGTGIGADGGSLISVQQWGKWLRSRGVNIVDDAGKPTLRAAVVQAWLDDHSEDEALLDGEVRRLLTCRDVLSGITTSKLRSVQDRLGWSLAGHRDGDGVPVMPSPMDRLRSTSEYHGAHTGRWAGRGVQLQNLPRPKGNVAADLEQWERVGTLPESAEVGDLLRAVFTAGPGKRLLIADYAGIEARCLAWLAGEERLTEAFRTGSDVYCEMASQIFGRSVTKADKVERQVGKVVVLGSGYGLGASGLERICRLSGVDLEAAGTSAQACIDAYRNTWQMIAGEPVPMGDHVWRRGGIWQKLGDAARTVCGFRTPGEPIEVVPGLSVHHDGSAMRIVLPSGREMVYREARLEDRVPSWGGDPRPTIVYTDPRGFDVGTYGGKLTENVCQAVCRDLLADALVRCGIAGLAVVLHVHDEIVAEADAGSEELWFRQLLELMSQPPQWADGFPLKVEGHTEYRYLKSPRMGFLHGSAFCGRIEEVTRCTG